MKKYILLYSFLVIAAFFVGRATVSTEKKIEHVKGEKITGSVPTYQLTPVKTEIPINPVLPYKLLIWEGKEIQVTDTAAIIAEYEKKRSYSLTAFDDKEKGKLELFPVLQYNSLQSLDWKFTPITKVVTRSKNRVFQPFISLSWSTLDYIGIGGGLFYHNLGFEYQYQKGYTDLKDGHLFGVKWKF